MSGVAPRYREDMDSNNPFRQLRAYAHDLRVALDEGDAGTIADDAEDLVTLIAGLVEAELQEPAAYPAGIFRGGYTDEEELA